MPSATESTLREPPSPTPPEKFDPYQLSDAAAKNEGRNFLVIALYQVIMRTGWIFKTESVVMPAVLDVISGGGALGGFLRGCLPVLNRIGHSIPPMLFSRRLKVMPQKRRATFVCSLAMSAVFLALAGMFWLTGSTSHWWMPVVFLVCYTLFFAVTGINNLSLGTLQGKLIHATRRGRLLMSANVVGAITAIAAASLLMPLWLTTDGGRFDMIFGFTALCFAVSALVLLLTIEPKDNFSETPKSPAHMLAAAGAIVRHDHNFRRLALVAMAFSSSLTLFPHYQALARSEPLNLPFDNLLTWVIVQNAGTALFSRILGPLADHRGNRLVMRLVLMMIALMPVTAITLAQFPVWGALFYPIVFVFIGLTPVGFKTLSNYTLEISPAEDHPRYLSTLGLCFAVPLVASPLLGWVIAVTGFTVVFCAISLTVFAGWLLTFRLHEPREALAQLHEEAETGLPEGS